MGLHFLDKISLFYLRYFAIVSCLYFVSAKFTFIYLELERVFADVLLFKNPSFYNNILTKMCMSIGNKNGIYINFVRLSVE